MNLSIFKFLLVPLVALSLGCFAQPVFAASTAKTSADTVEKETTKAATKKAKSIKKTVKKSTKDTKKAAKKAVAKKININTADVKTLQTLKGIGPEKAKAIVAYRKKHGKFKALKDIKEVPGIGDKIYAEISSGLKMK